MKKLYLVLAMLFLGLAFTAHAMAFQLVMDGNPYLGPIQFKYNNWDQGTLYNPNTNATGLANGTTDSYAIASVTNIQGQNAFGNWVDLWTSSDAEAIEGILYGIDDNAVNLVNGTGTISSVGGKLAFYIGPRNLNPSAGPGAGPSGLNAPTDIWNATDGTLFLSGDFVPGVTGDGVTTYQQQIDSITQPISGHGIGYINLTGGAYYDLFNGNGYLNGAADFRISSNFLGYDPKNATFNNTLGWAATSYDPVTGAAVPEPTTMLLLGMGLAGMAFAGRKKKAA